MPDTAFNGTKQHILDVLIVGGVKVLGPDRRPRWSLVTNAGTWHTSVVLTTTNTPSWRNEHAPLPATVTLERGVVTKIEVRTERNEHANDR